MPPALVIADEEGREIETIPLGPYNIELAFSEVMSGGQGFNFDYTFASGSVSATPLPSTWGMMLLGLGVLGFIGYRHRRKRAACSGTNLRPH